MFRGPDDGFHLKLPMQFIFIQLPARMPRVLPLERRSVFDSTLIPDGRPACNSAGEHVGLSKSHKSNQSIQNTISR